MIEAIYQARITQNSPFAILQADHSGKITSEERISQPIHTGEWWRIQPPASMDHWDSYSFTPLKIVMALVHPSATGLSTCLMHPTWAGDLFPRGIRYRGRWEGGSGWGIHVNPWLIHVNVWQKPLQYCKVISLQLIKINGGIKKKKRKLSWISRILRTGLRKWVYLVLKARQNAAFLIKVSFLSTDTCLAIICFWVVSNQT